MDPEHILSQLALIVVLGVSAQWLAWRLRLPSILLLLIFGFVAGPVTRVIDPREVFGDLVSPVVSIAVALILFEGGLSLRFRELQHIGGVVRNLVTIGALVTGVLAALAARALLVEDWRIAILLGSILVVTGPTVIVPLLRHVRPAAKLESILRWEGIVIDPIGATLAVLVFIAIREGHFSAGGSVIAFLRTVAVGGVIGLAGAGLLYVTLKRYLIPDFLQNAVSLMVVVGVFAASNLLQEESGVVAATLMGIALANQRSVAVRHIVEFKENLQVLLIAGLFIVLSGSLERDVFQHFDGDTALFLTALIVVVRPLSVFVSTIRSGLNWKEKVFLSMLAPRGIVAAAVASVFALHLEGMPQANLLVPFTFVVIVTTVAFYGLGAPLVARWLGLAESSPQGTVIIGAHALARGIANALKSAGCRVLLVDTNRANLLAARMDGLATHCGNALAEHTLESLELDGMGRLLALTPNDEVNSLAALHFREVFSRAEIYQLVPAGTTESNLVPKHLRGRYLFGEDVTFDELWSRWSRGARIKSTPLTSEFGFTDFKSHYGDAAVPLFLVDGSGRVSVIAITSSPSPSAGDVLISLASEEAGESGA